MFPVGKKKIEGNTNNLLSLNEYERLAYKTVNWYCKKKENVRPLLMCPEAISFLMYKLMIADMKWDETKNRTKVNYRIVAALWAIKYVLRKRKKTVTLISNYDFSNVSYEDNPADNLMNQESKDGLLSVLDGSPIPLTARERDILSLRYEHNKTLHLIGEKYSITRERVRQIIKRATKKLNGIQA